ncbi:MAG: hypothetical protein MAG795_00770 [Candidatus Woesearchaeota archaeon]|nr:hypothetical protein [Candidatus Woesearchaeota archaeon]
MIFSELVIVVLFLCLFLFIGYIIGRIIEARKWKSKERDIRKDAIKRSRAALTGSFSEQLAPYLPGFKYSPTEVRFIGKPIDFIVFKGLDKKEPQEVVFVEVKSGKSSLSTVERKLRDAIKQGKVRWEKYSVMDEQN